MKVRFTYWNLEYLNEFMANYRRMKKVQSAEQVSKDEIIVTFKKGTTYEYIKDAAVNATITLA